MAYPQIQSPRRRWGRTLRWLAILLVVATLTGCAYRQHIDRGDAFFHQGQYVQALAEYEKAEQIEPDSTEVADKITQTKRRLVEIWATQARDHLAQQRWMDAVEVAGKALEAMPEAEQVRALVVEVSTAVQQEAEARIESKSFGPALQLLEGVRERLPTEAVAVTPTIEDAEFVWSQRLQAQAQSAEDDGLLALAYLLWSKAAQLQPGQGLEARSQALRGPVARRARYVVRGVARRGQLAERSLAGIAASLDATSVALVESARPAPDATLDVRVRGPRFDTARDQRTETVRYQSSTRRVENPFYRSRVDELSREERELVRAQEDVDYQQSKVDQYRDQVAREGPSPNTSTGAEQNLYNAENRLEAARRKVSDQRRRVQRAREELRNTPQFEDEPVYSDLSYTVTVHRRTGEADLLAKLEHADAREPLTVERGLQITATDEEHTAYPQAGVSADPLELPTQAALADELVDRATADLVALIQQSFDGWRARLFEKAVGLADARQRADTMVVYVLTAPGQVRPEAAQQLADDTGIVDSAQVLVAP